MPAPGFRRSLPLLDLSPAETTQMRLDPERELTAGEIALGAAKAGALGGPVAGDLGRSMISYENWLSDIESRPVIFRGLRGDAADPTAPLAGSRFRAAYGGPNPAVAATYATPSQADLSKYGGHLESPENRPRWRDPSGERVKFHDIAEGGSVYPLRASSQDIQRYSQAQLDELRPSLQESRLATWDSMLEVIRNPQSTAEQRKAAGEAIDHLQSESDFNTLSSRTPRGKLTTIADSVDAWAEYPPLDPSRLSALPGDVYSWTDASAVEPAGKPFRANETSEILRAAARRLGYPEEGLQNQTMLDAQKALEPPHPALAGMHGGRQARLRGTPYSYVQSAPLSRSRTVYTDKAQELIDEVQNDPRFKPTRGARTARFLKGMVKEALKPKNILLDALVGSGVGAGSALAGYAAGQPRSAGVFNLPGEYRQALSQEDLLAQIEAKTARKEVLRQQYIDEVNALHGEGTLQPGARIEEISDYLGPVRGLQGR